MRWPWRIALSSLCVLGLSTVALSQSVFINEIHYDNTGTDAGEAIEIAGPAGTDLSGWSLVLYNGNGGAVYNTLALSGIIADQQSGFGTLAFTYPVNGIQNGSPDGIALVNGTTVVQFLSYEGTFTAVGGPANGLLSSDIGVIENGSEDVGMSLRLTGTGSQYSDFTWATPASASFGAINAGQTFTGGVDVPPTVVATDPDDGATSVPADTGITITFSENVTADATAFAIDCPGSVPLTVHGGQTSYTLTPTGLLPSAATCTVTVFAAEVVDEDGTPLAEDFTFTFTTEAQFLCGEPATLLHEIQGSGLMSPLHGQPGIVIEGIVVGDFQATTREGQPDPGLSGFFVQEEDVDWDGDSTTSEGIFVFQGNASTSIPDVQVGDRVRLQGTVVEFTSTGITLTELSNVTRIAVCDTGNPFTRTTVSLPVGNITDWERYEGMAIRIAQELTVTGNFNLGSFGEVDLALGQLPNPTNVVAPGAEAIALQADNDRRRIILDDGSNLARAAFDPPARLYPQDDPTTIANDPGLSADNTLRVGDTVNAPWDGVLDQRFGAYRIHSTAPVIFHHDNPRPELPEPVGGTLRVASFNVLNYFTTLDDGSPICGPASTLDCRGANSATEFTRQRDKIINALVTMNAHIVGLIELENNATASLQSLVDGLNLATAPGTYAFIPTDTIGTDAIKVGLIYQPARIRPVGAPAILTNAIDPRTIDTQSRPPLAQTFERRKGARPDLQRFTVVINHFKSKGSDCNAPDQGTSELTDPDTGDGQGNCNLTRISIAQALLDWLASDPTGSHDPDVLILGDLNAYAQEHPIQALTDPTFNPPDPSNQPNLFGPNPNATYTNMVARFLGDEAYSFQFQGQSGYLDHALASRALVRQVTGVTEWHINADEPVALDYNEEWIGAIGKNATQLTLLYNAEPYRASDHDPVLIGLNLLCGDLDDDGEVDVHDLARFLTSLGSSNPRADYDGSGRVTLADYRLWLKCYLRFLRVIP